VKHGQALIRVLRQRVGRRKERDGNREKCPHPPHSARLALQHPVRSVDSGKFARRQVFEMIKAPEQGAGCDLCVDRVETAAEFVEQLGFAEGAVSTFSPSTWPLGYEVDPYLVRSRGSEDLRIVVLVCLDDDPTHQILDIRAPNKAVGIFGKPGARRSPPPP
jgi:hypothetical protein